MMANTIPQLVHRNFCGTYFSKKKLNIIFSEERCTLRKSLYYVAQNNLNNNNNFCRQQ